MKTFNRLANTLLLTSLRGAFVSFALCAPLAKATPLASDSFLTDSGKYTVGSICGQGPSIVGFSGNWLSGWADAGNPNPSSCQIVKNSLSVSVPGYSIKAEGGSIQNITATNFRVGRAFDGAKFAAGSKTTVYISFLLQLGGGVTGYQGVELGDGNGFDDNTDRSFQLGVSDSGDFGPSGTFGIRVNDGATAPQFLGLGPADANVHLFVIKFTLKGPGSSDNTSEASVTAWEDPKLTGSDDPPGGTKMANISLRPLSMFTIASFNAPAGLAVDSIQIGTTLADVTKGNSP